MQTLQTQCLIATWDSGPAHPQRVDRPQVLSKNHIVLCRLQQLSKAGLRYYAMLADNVYTVADVNRKR